jgi:Cu-processing system ATP-binding protein
VQDVSLAVEEGEAFGLIGPNGAGKTTLFKMLVGLTDQTSGEIFIDEVKNGGRSKTVRKKLGYLPENVAFYDNLTALETLRFFAKVKGIPEETYPQMLETVKLDACDRKVGSYSRGMRQRLGLAVALLGEPRILILDEPTAGLDPRGVREFQQMIKSLRSKGVTVVLSSHVLGEVQEIVDRIGIMNHGKIIATGSFKELRDRAGLRCKIEATLEEPDRSIAEAVLTAGAEKAVLSKDKLIIECSGRDKLRVLATLTEQKIIDLEIKEPSLEDVFLKYTGGADG